MNMRITKRSIPGLGERALAVRHRLGLSQQVAATRAAMSTNRLRDLERHGLATTDTLVRLARALGVPVDDLTGRAHCALPSESKETNQ
jgi:transcriptional regulator with XRE-family HTH domain